MKSEAKSSKIEEGQFQTLRGSDPVLDWMLDNQAPLTREEYLSVAGLTEPLEPEVEATLPRPFQRLENPLA